MQDLGILPAAIFLSIFAIFGISGNAVMIICVILTKKFRSPCHFLIGFTCLADALHLSGQIPFVVHFFGSLTSSQSQCYFMCFLPLLGVLTGGPLILAMGLDRLIAVQFPTKYRYYQENPNFYMVFQLIFPIFYALSILTYGFYLRDSDPENQIICSNPSALRGKSFQIFTYSSALIYLVVILIYLTVALILKAHTSSTKNIFRSIAVTVGIVVGGWTLTTVVNIFSYQISEDAYYVELVQLYAGLTVNAAMASNVFIFYGINSEYRKVIRQLFGWDQKSSILSTTRIENSVRITPRKMTSPVNF